MKVLGVKPKALLFIMLISLKNVSSLKNQIDSKARKNIRETSIPG